MPLEAVWPFSLFGRFLLLAVWRFARLGHWAILPLGRLAVFFHLAVWPRTIVTMWRSRFSVAHLSALCKAMHQLPSTQRCGRVAGWDSKAVVFDHICARVASCDSKAKTLGRRPQNRATKKGHRPKNRPSKKKGKVNFERKSSKLRAGRSSSELSSHQISL